MLFYFYLISVAFSIIITRLTTTSFLERLRKNHICILESFSFWEEVLLFVFSFLKIIFPVYNLVYDIYLIVCQNKIYERFITRLFLLGKAEFRSP